MLNRVLAAAFTVLAVVAVLAVVPTGATNQVESSQAFEVASIKRNTTNPNAMSIGCRPGGRWLMVNGTIADLIRFAYPSETRELRRASGWVNEERYDVDARAAGNPPCSDMSVMMRTLLAERLNLIARYESREEDVFALVVASPDGRLGPQMRRSDLDCDAIALARREGRPVDVTPPANGAAPCGMSAGPDGLKFGGSRLSVLAASISNSAGRYIVDKTGLEGFYEFTLQFAGERAIAQGTAGDRPDIFTALREQLGLRLQPDRAVLRSVVIDSIERPTEN